MARTVNEMRLDSEIRVRTRCFHLASFSAAINIAIAVMLVGCGGGGGGGGTNQYISLYTALASEDLDLDGSEDIAEARMRFEVQGTGTGFKPKNTHYVTSIALQDSLNPGSFIKSDVRYANGDIDKLGGYPSSIAVGDLNNDAFPDLALAVSTNVNILMQNINDPGNFLPHVDVQAESGPIDVAIVDLNADGMNDIAVATEPLTLLFNDPAAPGSQFLSGTLPINASSVAVGDLDSDGRNDIAATGRDAGDDKVYILLQNHAPAAPGEFSLDATYTVGYKPVAIIIVDLNGDTLLDLAVVNEGETVGSVSILLQDDSAPGTFLSETQYTTDRESCAIDVGDLNGDTLPDLVIANSGANNVSLLFQDALHPGDFTPASTLKTTEHNIADIVIGEFTGDALVDIAVAAEAYVFLHAQDENNPGTFHSGVKL